MDVHGKWNCVCRERRKNRKKSRCLFSQKRAVKSTGSFILIPNTIICREIWRRQMHMGPREKYIWQVGRARERPEWDTEQRGRHREGQSKLRKMTVKAKESFSYSDQSTALKRVCRRQLHCFTEKSRQWARAAKVLHNIIFLNAYCPKNSFTLIAAPER